MWVPLSPRIPHLAEFCPSQLVPLPAWATLGNPLHVHQSTQQHIYIAFPGVAEILFAEELLGKLRHKAFRPIH